MERPEHEFHVIANEIRIDFDVPLPVRGVDEVLSELLSHHALEIIKDRRHRGQPLEGIAIAQVSAKRLGESVVVAKLDLSEPDDIPEVKMPALLPRLGAAGYDPLARFGEGEEKNLLRLAEKRSSDDLDPPGSFLHLTMGVTAGLRSMGIDPEMMTVTELGKGLLDLAGYTLTGKGDGTLVASGMGTSTFVYFVDHVPGEHPELSRQTIAVFLVAFSKARTERGLLITDKFGPYDIYQKERANPDCFFITRERLQGFVDSVALS